MSTYSLSLTHRLYESGPSALLELADRMSVRKIVNSILKNSPCHRKINAEQVLHVSLRLFDKLKTRYRSNRKASTNGEDAITGNKNNETGC